MNELVNMIITSAYHTRVFHPLLEKLKYAMENNLLHQEDVRATEKPGALELCAVDCRLDISGQ